MASRLYSCAETHFRKVVVLLVLASVGYGAFNILGWSTVHTAPQNLQKYISSVDAGTEQTCTVKLATGDGGSYFADEKPNAMFPTAWDPCHLIISGSKSVACDSE